MRLSKILLSLFLILPFSSTMAHDDHDQDTIAIHILMDEMSFQVEGQDKGASLQLQPGRRYELIFRNVGAMKHEVLFGRNLIKRDGLAIGYREHLLKDVEVDVEIEVRIDGEDREIEIEAFGLKELEMEPGTEASISFELPSRTKGRWELGCFIAGHYEGGMRLDLLIE